MPNNHRGIKEKSGEDLIIFAAQFVMSPRLTAPNQSQPDLTKANRTLPNRTLADHATP